MQNGGVSPRRVCYQCNVTPSSYIICILPSIGLLRFSDDTEKAERELFKLVSDKLVEQVKEGFPRPSLTPI